MMDIRKQELFMVLFTLAVVFIGTFLYSDRVTVDLMEPRNYITAREMVENRTWLLPTMEGKLRIAKPPLPTWITAWAMMWAGTDTNLVANRIPAGICALLLCLFTYLIARRLSADRGFAIATLIVLATSVLYLVSARRNEWDIYVHTFMAGAIWALLEILGRTQGKTLYTLLFSLFMALSFYSKGPVAFWAMLLPFLLSYWIAYGKARFMENRWRLLVAFGLCVLISSAWPLYVYLNTPEQATAIARIETRAWFTTSIGPLWSYLRHTPAIVGIWLPMLLYGLLVPFLRKDATPGEKLCAWWYILIVAFLTAVPEKRLRYILPALVPGAMVSTFAIYRLREALGWPWGIVYGSFCLGTGGLLIAAAGALAYLSPVGPFSVAGVLSMGFSGALLIFLFMRRRTKNAHLIAAAGACLAIVFLGPAAADRLGPDIARSFLHVREIPGLKDRVLCVSPKHIDTKTITYDMRWAMNKNIQLHGNYIQESVAQNGRVKPYALMTTRWIDPKVYGWHLADTIRTKDATYYIYLIPGSRQPGQGSP